jgi:hypothetical protein
MAMSHSWYLYTEAAPAYVLEVEAAYTRLLEEQEEAWEEQDWWLAEIGAGGGPPPSPQETREREKIYRERTPEDVLARLGRCRSTVSFDYVRGSADDSPLQVAALRFFLGKLAPCVLDFGGPPLEMGERVIARLRRARGVRFEERVAVRPRRPVRSRPAKTGELRALAILARFKAAAEDQEEAIDLRKRGAALSLLAQRYLRLLIEDGPLSDRAAARRLGSTPSVLGPALAEVERAFARP